MVTIRRYFWNEPVDNGYGQPYDAVCIDLKLNKIVARFDLGDSADLGQSGRDGLLERNGLNPNERILSSEIKLDFYK